MTDHVKVRFTHENSDGGTEVESMWAIERQGGYEIDSIPFRVMSIAQGDLVAVRRDADGLMWFVRVLAPSGHSTIQILFRSAEEVESFRADLARLGCASEGSDLPELIAVDVPPSVKYEELKALLDAGEREGRFEYQESCLGGSLPNSEK
jgi:hypothetical protein